MKTTKNDATSNLNPKIFVICLFVTLGPVAGTYRTVRWTFFRYGTFLPAPPMLQGGGGWCWCCCDWRSTRRPTLETFIVAARFSTARRLWIPSHQTPSARGDGVRRSSILKEKCGMLQSSNPRGIPGILRRRIRKVRPRLVRRREWKQSQTASQDQLPAALFTFCCCKGGQLAIWSSWRVP